MKLTKQQVELIKKLSSEGKRQFEIAKELNIAQTQVNYYVTSREDKIKKMIHYQKNLSKERKKEIYKRKNPYLKKYMFNRYHNDEEFRNKIKEKSKEYQRRKRNG